MLHGKKCAICLAVADSEPKELSKNKYIAHRRAKGLAGANNRALELALADGRIQLNKNGKIDVAEADASWPDLRPSKKGYPGDASPVETLTDMRIVTERLKARELELDLKEREGSLIDAKEVEARAFALARQVRDAILAVADRLAPELAAETTVLGVENTLKRELSKALSTLSTGFEGEKIN